MTYTVWYKTQDQFFWRKLHKVKGDGILESNTHRYFITDNEERIEIPLNYLFRFEHKRFLVIKKNMEKESGQSIITE